MGAFIIAGIVAVITIIISLLMLFAAGMSDAPSAVAKVPVTSTFVTGMVIAGLIAATHWLPHIGW
jgi:hypothetical protein